jgi:hypothetical protein
MRQGVERARGKALEMRSFGILIVVAAATCGQAAWAQNPNIPTPVSSPVPRDVGAPKQGPTNDPNNEELGVTVGSFRLYPTLDTRGGYDSNVFARPSGQHTESGYFDIRPSLELRSDWNNHMLNVAANGGFGIYTNAPTQNYQNASVAADGRIDIQRDWYLTGKLGYQRVTEALGSPNVAFSSTPTVVNSVPAEVGMYQRFNRFFYQLTAGASILRHQDNSALSATGLPGSSRDRNEFNEIARAGYEVTEGVDLWLQGGFNQRRYIQALNSANQQRDSNGWSAVVGATVDLGGISKLEGFVGYTQQYYLNSIYSSTGSYTFGLAGVWNGYAPLVLRPFFLRSIQETAFTNYKNYLSTVMGFEFYYTITSEWQLNGGASYTIADYQALDGLANVPSRTDNFYRASLGLMYSIRPQVLLGPMYEYASSTGSDPNNSPDYGRHIAMMRLVVKR